MPVAGSTLRLIGSQYISTFTRRMFSLPDSTFSGATRIILGLKCLRKKGCFEVGGELLQRTVFLALVPVLSIDDE
jgi:hypothetical protein